jgi:hypothetical protein
MAATSSKTGGYNNCRPFPDGNANESRRSDQKQGNGICHSLIFIASEFENLNVRG